MIKALTLAAALALLPVSAAVARDARGPSEDALEAAAEAFEARMDEFGDRAEAISDDESLTGAQREARIRALWTEYQPDVARFTALAAQYAPAIAQEALADIDVEAIVEEALEKVDVDAVVEDALTQVRESGALAVAEGVATNGAWASNDPEHAETMGLVAQYAMGEAVEAIDTARIEADALATEAAARDADAADEDEAPAPPAPAA